MAVAFRSIASLKVTEIFALVETSSPLGEMSKTVGGDGIDGEGTSGVSGIAPRP